MVFGVIFIRSLRLGSLPRSVILFIFNAFEGNVSSGVLACLQKMLQ